MSSKKQQAQASVTTTGLTIERRHTTPGVNPLDTVEYAKRRSVITNPDGSTVFEMNDVEVPASWSQLATDIIVSKYFRKRGVPGKGGETSAKQVVHRLAHSMRTAGEKLGGYFATAEDAEAFESELAYYLIHQIGAFNSPVWFNVGLFHEYGIDGSGGNWFWNPDAQQIEKTANAYEHPQGSACFIQKVDDDLMSIFDLAKNEARLFKYGSGTGTNFSRLRGRQERLSGGGTSSGLMSFLEVLDRGAGATKSGGTTRRAAKMVCLDMDHPEIADFINWKVKEEAKVKALIEAGYSSDFNGDAYRTVAGQNSNNSVRIPDSFMEAYLNDDTWSTYFRTTGELCETFQARALMQQIANAAWGCADPGVQFDSTINTWHTCKATGRINGSNPCVTGDTMVATTQGLRPIIDLVGQSVDVVTQDGRVAHVSEIFPTGFKNVFELRTRCGYTLKLTADHRVWTRNRGDVAAQDLTTTDELVLIPSHFGRTHLDHEMAQFIGLALGDGCKNSDAQGSIVVTMASGEADILAESVDYLNSIKADRKIAGVRFTDTGVRTSTSAEVVTSVVNEYAVLNEGSNGKRLLQAAFALDRSSIAAVLRGLFTSDGTVANYGEKSQYVALDSTSLTMLRQVQQLLLAFGIKAKLYENRRAGKLESLLPDGHGGLKSYTVQEMHSLRISRSSRVLFENEIGFHPQSEKCAALRALNAEVGTYRDELVDTFESLTKLGTQKVYDLTEPLTHHFAADGILVHNCSEYMFLDDTACNLSSINLLSLYDTKTAQFDIATYRHAIRIFFIAQEILVDFCSYPTQSIAQNSHDYRPLGLGYANLGTLLMVQGIPYDSDEARAICSALTAILTGHAYVTSAEMAASKGAFDGFAKNRDSMLGVIGMHRDAAYAINTAACPTDLYTAACTDWDLALRLGKDAGYRNAQATVIAPTGTIGLLMDCDTTGIEPDFALVKFKKLAGGGYFKIINQSIPAALTRLGYTAKEIDEIIAYVKGTSTLVGAPEINSETLAAKGVAKKSLANLEAQLAGAFDLRFACNKFTLGDNFTSLTDLGFSEEQIEIANRHICGTMTIEGAPHLKPAHLPVFDCANKCGKDGVRFLQPMSHIGMMAAAQPFVSGAISKTINVPNETTAQEIEQLYLESWKMGLKACALYRDGSKNAQPLSSTSGEGKKKSAAEKSAAAMITDEVELPRVAADASAPPAVVRRRLPKKRLGFTQEARVAGNKVYLRTGEYEDGTLGEMFIDMHKEGAAFRSMMNCFAIAVSLGLQHGVPLEEFVNVFTFTRFEPSGPCDHPNIKMVTSIIDYIFRVVGMEYLGRTDFVQVQPEATIADAPVTTVETARGGAHAIARRLEPTGASRLDAATLAKLEQLSGSALPVHSNSGGNAETLRNNLAKNGATKNSDAHELPAVMVTRSASTTSAGGGLQTSASTMSATVMSEHLSSMMGDAPFCDSCGNVTVRNGSCYRCLNCGNSMGCS